MRNSLKPSDDMFKAVREILLNKWDPIRIQELPDELRLANQDEYDRYIKYLIEMIIKKEDELLIKAYLLEIETGRMGQKTQGDRAAIAARALYSLGR